MPIEIPQLNLSTKNSEHLIANIGPPSKSTSAYVISSLLQPPNGHTQLLSTTRLSLDQRSQPWFTNALGWDNIASRSSRGANHRLNDSEKKTKGQIDDEPPTRKGRVSRNQSATLKGKERQRDDEDLSGDESEDEDEDEEGEWFERGFSRRLTGKNLYREQLKAQMLNFLRDPDPRYHEIPNSELLKTILHSTTHYYTSQSPPLLDELGYKSYLTHMARLARHANKQTRRRRRLRKKQFAEGGSNVEQGDPDEDDEDGTLSSTSSSSSSYSSCSASSSALSSSGSSFSSRSARDPHTLRRTRSQSAVLESSKYGAGSLSESSRRRSNSPSLTKRTPRTLSKSASTDDWDSKMSGTRGKKARLANGLKKVILRKAIGRKEHDARRTRWRAVSKTDMYKSLDGDSLIALGVLLEEHVRHQVHTRGYGSYRSALSPTPEPTQSSSPLSIAASDGGGDPSEGKRTKRTRAEEGEVTGTESANSDVFDMRDSDTE